MNQLIMDSNDKGFFVVGDAIEVAGKLEGIVAFANESHFGFRQVEFNDDECVLRQGIIIFKNDKQYYSDKYWIKKIKAPAYITEAEYGYFV